MKHRILLFATVLLLLSGSGLPVMNSAGAPQNNAAKPDIIELELCRINTLKQVEVTFDRPGILSFVEPSSIGEFVEKGKTVARLRDEVAQTALDVATKRANSYVEEKYARAAHAVAKVSHDRSVEANTAFQLRNKDRKRPDPYPPREIERLRLEMQRAELQIEKAVNDLAIAALEQRQAEEEMHQYEVKSEHSGVVTTVHKHLGEAVRQGDPVLTITDLATVEAIGRIHVFDFPRVRQGDPVVVFVNVSKDRSDAKLEMEKRRFEGRIAAFGDEWDPLHTTLDVIVKVQNQKDRLSKYLLREGLPVRMVIYPRGSEPQPALSGNDR